MTFPEETTQKLERLRQLLDRHNLDALLLRRISSFAWATGGAASYVNTAAAEGAAALLVTRQEAHLLTNSIEAPRLRDEEGLEQAGWQFHVEPWPGPAAALNDLSGGLRLGADSAYPGAQDLSGELARLRASLTFAEGQRFRQLGRLCAQSVDAASNHIRPGQSEYEIAALLGFEAQRRGVQPVVLLVAVDERLLHYRHPLPTSRKLEKTALLVLCGRREGLVCSISRMLSVGPVEEDLRRKLEIVSGVYAVINHATRPGRTTGEVFSAAQAAYAHYGLPDEWLNHHQGGAAGYEPREYLGSPGSQDLVQEGQVFAWNPSAAGAKAEDTILVRGGGPEVLTKIPGWPVVRVQPPGMQTEVDCPGILEI
jgi:Xaa-Pro aminopeptidase